MADKPDSKHAPKRKASPAQVHQNRLNAAKSTGPKTDEGKARSKLNALKHGLRAESPLLPDEDAEGFANRVEAWVDALEPDNAVQLNLAENAAIESWALDRTRRFFVRSAIESMGPVPAYPMQPIDFDTIESELRRDPIGARRKLHGCPEGVAWMIDRWDFLAEQLERYGYWSPERFSLAADLMGLPAQPDRIHDDPDLFRLATLALALGAARHRDDPKAFVLALTDLFCACDENVDAYHTHTLAARLLSAPPVDPDEARAELFVAIEINLDRLRPKLERLKNDAKTQVHLPPRPLLAPEASLILRYMAHHQRSLLANLRALFAQQKEARKLDRPAAEPPPVRKPSPPPPPAPNEPKADLSSILADLSAPSAASAQRFREALRDDDLPPAPVKPYSGPRRRRRS